MKTRKISHKILFILCLGVVFACSSRQNSIEDKLVGTWLRSDGTYKIEIEEVKEDGILTAKYFNPGPINVGTSEWRLQHDELQIFVELQDKNYPGSIYKLTFDEASGMLTGTYYQAVTKETYEVSFKQVK